MCGLVFSSRTGEPRNPEHAQSRDLRAIRYSMRKNSVPAGRRPILGQPLEQTVDDNCLMLEREREVLQTIRGKYRRPIHAALLDF